jgi:hypothetical protein
VRCLLLERAASLFLARFLRLVEFCQLEGGLDVPREVRVFCVNAVLRSVCAPCRAASACPASVWVLRKRTAVVCWASQSALYHCSCCALHLVSILMFRSIVDAQAITKEIAAESRVLEAQREKVRAVSCFSTSSVPGIAAFRVWFVVHF